MDEHVGDGQGPEQTAIRVQLTDNSLHAVRTALPEQIPEIIEGRTHDAQTTRQQARCLAGDGGNHPVVEDANNKNA